MELSQLNYFCTLAKIQHFTRTAEELHITQPALSKAIGILEAELGVSLFDRVGKMVHLNPAGQAFFQLIDPILAELDSAQTRMRELQHGIHGTLGIGAAFSLETAPVLQTYLRRLFWDYPAVSLRTSLYPQRKIERLLLERSLDFGFALTLPKAKGIAWEEIMTEPLGLVVGRAHPLAGREDVLLEQAAKEPFLCCNAVWDIHDTTKFILKQAGFDISVIYEGPDLGLMAEAVGQNRGVMLLSKAAFSALPSGLAGGLAFVPVADPVCQRSIYLLFRSSRYQPEMYLSFVTGLRRQVLPFK